MKQTAVEFIFEEFKNRENGSYSFTMEQIYNKAKEIEKQQIIDANISGMEFIAVDPNHYNNDAEQYYNETFKNK